MPMPSLKTLLARRPHTRRVFTGADMKRMHALYYHADTPLIEVAGAFEVRVSTFMRWISEMDWPRRSQVSSGAAERPAPGRRVSAPAAKPLPPAPPYEPGKGRLEIDQLCFDITITARRQLQSLSLSTQEMSITEREKTARILASLARTVERSREVLLDILARERAAREEEEDDDLFS